MFNKKALTFYLFVLAIVCTAHATLLYCAAQYKPSTPKADSKLEKTITMEVVQIEPQKEPETIEPELITKENIAPSPKPQKNEPRLDKQNKPFTAPIKSPERQLAAKAHEAPKKNEELQVAKTQTVQTTQTNAPSSNNTLSSQSNAEGNANKTVGYGTEKSGTSAKSGSPNVGKETQGGSGGGVSQKARLKSINKTYDEDLKSREKTGTVTVSVVVNTKGRAKSVTILNSTNPALNRKAKLKATNAQYTPKIVNGEQVESIVTYPITYKM